MTPRLEEDDGGSAIIEFVFAAIIVMLPLLYLITSVAAIQRSQLTVSQAAREAGRAFATADHAANAMSRAQAAVRITLHDEDLHDVDVRFVRTSCKGPRITPQLRAGAVFAVCVSRHISLPGLPHWLHGRGITSQGKYIVHVDDFRATS